MDTERIVIVGYRPYPGKTDHLFGLLRDHIKILRKEGLASDRQPVVMQAQDGTCVEIFGWKSKEAIESAHTNPAVQKMWEAFQGVCDYVPVGELAETKELFSEFAPVF